MFDKESIYFDVWRSLNENLFKAYADCYIKLSTTQGLDPKKQLGDALEKFGILLEYDSNGDTYNSAYTIARELAIFGQDEGGTYFVNPLIDLFHIGEISYRDYLLNFFLRWEVLIQGRVVHPLSEFVNRFNSGDIISKESLKSISTIYSPNSHDNHLLIFLKRLQECGVVEKVNRNEFQVSPNIDSLKAEIIKTCDDPEYYRMNFVKNPGNFIKEYFPDNTNVKFDDNLIKINERNGDEMSVDDSIERSIMFPSFSILGGISGTGKSRFIKSQALLSNGLDIDSIDKIANFKITPVKPDWHEPSDLMGYVSRIGSTKSYILTDFFKYICRAWISQYKLGGTFSSPKKDVQTYWFCLDEMNLAPVEQYFSDFLSINESRRWKAEEYYCESIVSTSQIRELNKNYWMEVLKSEFEDAQHWVLTKESFTQFLNERLKNGTVKKYLNSLDNLYKAFVSPQTSLFDISDEIRELLNDVKSAHGIAEHFYTLDKEISKKVLANFIKENRSQNKLSQWASKSSAATGDGSLSAVCAKFIEFISLLEDPDSSTSIQRFTEDLYEFGLPIPPNLMVVGTVNMDETTHAFSRKVLDRAFSIDYGQFFPNEFDIFFEDSPIKFKPLTCSTLTHLFQIDENGSKKYFGSKFDPTNLSVLSAAKDFLKSLNNQTLKSTPFEVGYRALDQLLLMVEYWYEGNKESLSDDNDKKWLASILDEFVMTKILPRVEGDIDKLGVKGQNSDTNILQVLKDFLNEHEIFKSITSENSSRFDLFREKGDDPMKISCRSIVKIDWMISRLEKSGYTSFWI